MCTGFCCVAFVPSPKSHSHEVGDPVLWSVKLTLSGAFPVVWDAEKTATGAFTPFETVIYLAFVTELLPIELSTFKLTAYFPASLYMCTGFCCVAFVPSPKRHSHEVGDPVLWSVKLTLSGAFPVVWDAEKTATGAFTPFETVI